MRNSISGSRPAPLLRAASVIAVTCGRSSGWIMEKIRPRSSGVPGSSPQSR